MPRRSARARARAVLPDAVGPVTTQNGGRVGLGDAAAAVKGREPTNLPRPALRAKGGPRTLLRRT
jgi:hypothetical protein